jgi:hypothetical protein
MQELRALPSRAQGTAAPCVPGVPKLPKFLSFLLPCSLGDTPPVPPTLKAACLSGEIQNIPLGRYYAIAAENISALLLGDQGRGLPEPPSVEQRRFWTELVTIATPVTLRPGDKLDLNLEDKIIEAARIAARIGAANEYENLHPPNNQSCCRQ